MRAHTKLVPNEGWARYTKSRALIDYAVSLTRTKGWRYLNPTSDTLVVEAPASSGNLYLEVREGKAFDAVLYPPTQSDPEFDRVASDLATEFHLQKDDGYGG